MLLQMQRFGVGVGELEKENKERESNRFKYNPNIRSHSFNLRHSTMIWVIWTPLENVTRDVWIKIQ